MATKLHVEIGITDDESIAKQIMPDVTMQSACRK